MRSFLLAPVLALVLLAVPLTDARAAKPQPPPPAPTITAIAYGTARFSLDRLDLAIWAAASDGRIYAAPIPGDGGPPGPFQEVGQIPGRPTSMEPVPGFLCVSLENGDLYGWADKVLLPPYTFTFLGNIFTQAGARLPAFPDLAPVEDARPILTGEGAPDIDDVGAPVGK